MRSNIKNRRSGTFIQGGTDTDNQRICVKRKEKFNARLIVDRESGKVKFYFPPAEETELICPFCNKSLKKYDWGYACPDRSGCGFHLGTNVCKHELTEDEVRQILVDGRTANYISLCRKRK